MAPDTAAAPQPSNRLLGALPRSVFDAISPFLSRVDLAYGQVLIGPMQPLDHAYFIESGLIALIARSEGRDGGGVAAALVGAEGLVGCPSLADMWDEAFHLARVQQAGQALRIRADLLRTFVERSPELNDACWSHLCALVGQMVRTASHSARHTLPERCGRWLLTAYDRAGGAELQVTHEGLATMLGVRRAGVTVALAELQSAGLIRGERGRVRVLDRPGLQRLVVRIPEEGLAPARAAARGRGEKLGVFAVRLRAVRAEYGTRIGQPGLSMREFADRLGVSFVEYERLEAALERPKLRFLVALHRRTGISIGRRAALASR